jgi:Zn-finger protein
MKQCKCGSYAINPHLHGRQPDLFTYMCDVCYWRHKAETAENLLECIKISISNHEKTEQAYGTLRRPDSDIPH